MQMRHRMTPILPLAALGGLVLVCGLGSPAAAQSTSTTQTTTTTTQTTTTTYRSHDHDYWSNYYALPEAPRYPEWSPGSINLFHWTDWTQTNWAPGSTYGVELDRMKAEREFWANRHMDDNAPMPSSSTP
ncbi:MAG TPA: hypothetical protein VKT32_12340 [Chthonomonadaceae bacterium]|nr:hypothetical protein [Chthonomonadaceae bacterium]